MALQQASPVAKFEASPTESFISLPGDNYSPLFAPSTPSSTINPIDMMTPQSFSEDMQTPQLPAIKEETGASPSPEDIPTSSEKKQTKKRKSWGQVLPEPKTNLPPRKRAKTEDEKEQRRVERVLRNRRAAQSSRERKRLEVEALEHRNKELEAMLTTAKLANYALLEELKQFRRDTGVVTRSSSPLNPLRDAPLSLSPELFSSQDGHNPLKDTAHLVDELINSTVNPTVNPASLSPALSPVPDETQTDEASKESQPAVSQVGEGAQVVPGLADSDVALLGMGSAAPDDAAFSLGDSFGLSKASDTDRYVLESGLLASPSSSTLDDDYLAGDFATGFSGQSTFDPFDIDDFLNDDANHVASDIMAASDYAAADHSFEPKVNDAEIQVP
ncbi:Transcriptional activator hac1 [Metarhizium brunneum]|uniref:Transcriptional activator hac1 n=1 Tax=Metarhizium brunneum TaxID=500148 RepID=A0A7D5V0U8_9HYPO|nr:Transcriptional activator hac1 [Metarhizium brunneum]